MNTAWRRPWRAAPLMVGMLLGLAGCFSGGGVPGAPPPPGTITARFVPGRDTDAIVVTTIDRLPLRSAALVGPGGDQVPAEWVDLRNSPGELTEPGGNEQDWNPGEPVALTRLDAIVSVASLRLPDPVRYAHTWRDWRITLRLGEPGGAQGRTVVLAAPSPPG